MDDLKALGPTALADGATTCADQRVKCEQQAQANKQTVDATVAESKDENGNYQYAGNDCLAAGPPQVTAAMVRAQAVRLIPSAAVGVAPKGTSLVNIETVLWADAPRAENLAPVTILGQRVDIRIVLDHVSWNFGDGDSDDGPAGKAYDDKRDPCHERSCPDYYGHVYTHTGAVTVTAQAHWHASFSVAGGGPVDIGGLVDGPASDSRIVIKQARGVLVRNP